MRLRILMAISLLVLTGQASGEDARFRAGPIYTDPNRPGDVAVVVELSPPDWSVKSAFRLLADGKVIATSRDLKSFALSDQAMALVLSVDVSGSMKGGPLSDTKRGLRWFLEELANKNTNNNNRFALMTFADRPKLEGSGFVSDPLALKTAVSDLKPSGTITKFYEALSDALDLLNDDSLPKRRRIIVLTDGEDEKSNQTLGDVIDKSIRLGYPIDVVARGTEKKLELNELIDLAMRTGGRLVDASPGKSSVSEAMGRIYLNVMEHAKVVSFRYRSDSRAKTTSDVEIEFQQLGATPLTAKLAGEIPVPVINWALWSSVALLVIAVVVLLYLHFRSKKPDASEVVGEKPKLRKDVRVTEVAHRFPSPAAGRPAAVLIGESGRVVGMRIPVEKEKLSIGADKNNDLVIDNDDYVSGTHCSISYADGNIFLSDENSLNGTFLNDDKLSRQSATLSPNDRIRVGASTLRLSEFKYSQAVGAKQRGADRTTRVR